MYAKITGKLLLSLTTVLRKIYLECTLLSAMDRYELNS